MIEREIELDLTADELWELIGTADGWRQWLVDDVAIRVADGEFGTILDDGVERAVHIDGVDTGRGISFVWSEQPDEVSRVTIAIVDDPTRGPRIRVTEEWQPGATCADCPARSGARWDLRACLLCLSAVSACRV